MLISESIGGWEKGKNRCVQWSNIVMATALLAIIYITFIGLGIPDSIFGTAWPTIYAEFALPVSWANFITFTISGGTIVSSLFSAKLIRRFGTERVTAVSTVMTAVALLGFSLSGGFLFLWLMAIPLGLGAGAIDTALNNYVALHYSSSHMSFLHCFYGIGVSCSPFLMSLSLAENADWRSGYRMIFYIQLAISVLAVLTLPLWKCVKAAESEEESRVVVSIGSLLKMPKLYMIGLIFIGSCAIEYTCGNWGSTFLVGAKGVSVDYAARIITFYYIGMALGRFLSGIFAAKITSRQMVLAGQGIVALAIVLLLLPVPAAVSGVALFLIGLGNGPIFPNMIYLTPSHFGKDLSQSVMGLQMVLSYIGILCAPAIFGMIAQYIGVSLFPLYLIVLYAVMFCGTLLTQFSKK